MRPHSLLIVDDHAIVCQGIRSLLSHALPRLDFYTSGTGREASEQLKLHPDVDLVIVDVELPDMSGFDLIVSIRQLNPDVRVLVYTMHEEPWVTRELQAASVDGIVLKGEEPSELLTAVESLLIDLPYFSARFSALSQSNALPITDREREVLQLISQGYVSREIAEKLYVSENTIEYHRKQLMRRLEARNNAHLVRIAMDLGIVV